MRLTKILSRADRFNPVQCEALQPRLLLSADVPVAAQATDVHSLTLDATVTGSIEVADNTDEYRFNASAGQRVYLDVSELTGTPDGFVDFVLRDPSGGVIANSGAFTSNPNGADFENSVLLAVAGQYTLTVDARGPAVVDFAFRLGNAPLDVKTVSLGAVTSGSIEVPGGTDAYGFDAVAGQRVYLDVSQLTGAPGQFVDFVLSSPSGTVLVHTGAFTGAPDSADFDNAVVLPVSGQYTLSVDARGSAVADFTFILSDAPLDVKPLTLGATTSGSIEVPGGTDAYHFTAAAGQRVYLDVSQLTGSANGFTDFLLLDPAGNTLAHTGTFAGNPDPADFENAVPLTVAGDYTLLVDARGPSTSTFNFRLIEAPLEVKQLALDTAVTGSIEVPGGTDEYRFNGTAGQRVYLDITQLNGPQSGFVDFALRDPSGNVLVARGAFNTNPDPADFENAVVLPTAGVYSLIIDGRGSTISSFAFKLNNAPLDVRNIGFGAVDNGALEVPGSTDEYRFSGTAGQRVLVDVKEIAGAQGGFVDFFLVDPNGDALFHSGTFTGNPDAADRGLVELPVTGQYKLIVDARGPATATYQFNLSKEATATVSGTAWSAAFRNKMASAGLGASGYTVRQAGQQLPIPWTNINQVSIVYDRDVNLQQAAFSVRGRATGAYGITNYSYNASTRTATLTLDRSFRNDSITVLAGPADAAQFSMLPGDVNQSGGAVNATDLVLSRNRIGRSLGAPGTGNTAYSLFNDVNGDGVINASDLVLVRNRVGTSEVAPNLVAELFSRRRVEFDALGD